ncbi:MAG: phosphate ABC transporter substrate-binding protein [Methanoregula sp.]|nr:phosphate ABC transporter substrate-binding protein [Methanoregula sp.]
MKANWSSSLIITIGLAILLVAAMAVAGCTDTANKNTPAATPVSTPAAVVTAQGAAPAATTAAPAQITAAPAAPKQKQTIKISGSTTVLPIIQKAADKYMNAHPEADIQISGGGSGVGIQMISAKTVDIGMASRDLTKAELAKNPSFVVTSVAQDGIAIIVNPANTIPYITLDQLKNIYLGKITKWTEITGAGVPNTNNQIVIVGRDSASGTRVFFDETILLKATPINKMLEKNSNGAVTQTVAQTPGAIGYVSIGFVSNDVKAVPVWYDGQRIVAPTLDNIKTKTYPISRDMWIITNGNPSGLAGDFIKFIMSAEGQKIVADEGFVTVK